MIQRLLRSRWLYVGLVALLILLYGRALRARATMPLELREAPAQARELTWLPKELDASTVQRVAEQDPGLAILLSLFSIVVAGFAICGLALTAWSLRPGQAPRSVARRITPWSFGEVGRITALTLVVAGLLPFARLGATSYRLSEPFDPHVWVVGSMLFLDAFVILAILAFASGKRAAFGLSTRRVPAVLLEALRGYLAAFPWLFLLLFIVVEAVRRLGWTPPAEPIQELIFGEDRPGVLGLTVFLACVVGPLAEELFFRGVLYGAIRRRASRLMATLASGAAFALLHMNPVGFLPIMALGCLLASLYERTGSLLAPLAVHILHNTILMGFALMLRRVLTYA